MSSSYVESGLKVAWLGSVIDSRAVSKNRAISLAASYWQGGFIEALESLSVKTITISTMPHRAFPFGPFMVKPNIDDFINSDCVLYDYLNMKGLRERSKSRGIQRSLALLNDIDAIVSYNLFRECREAAAKFSRQHQVPWIEVCADAWESDPGWERLFDEVKLPDGYVFLSSDAYERCPVDNKILIHGGVPVRSKLDNFNALRIWPVKGNESVVFLYSGSFEYWSGLTLLLRAFISLPSDEAVSLVICGYGSLSDLDRRLIESDSRVQFLGTVSKSDLQGLSEKADILVNPRPVIPENVFNFPSKLLEYMSYQKVIVSTKTPGIPDSFSKMMILTTGSPDDLKAGLLQAAQMTEEQRRPILDQLAIYSTTHAWAHEAERLISFINTLKLELS